MKTMNRLFALVFFLTLSVNVLSQEIPIHLLRVEDSTIVGMLIAPGLDEFGDTTYQSIPVQFVNDSTLLLGGDTVIHSGNIEDYIVTSWNDLLDVPVDIVYQSELADSTAAIRADFPTGGGGGGTNDWNDLINVPVTFADNLDNVDDADADAQNELQTLSYSNGVIGLTGQAGNITQSELNYWSSTVTELNSNAKSLVAVTNNDKLSFYENDVPQADAYFKLGNITGQTGKYIPTIFLKRNSTVSGFGATIISDALSNDGIPSLTISSRVNNSSSTNPILVLKNLSSNRFEVSSIGDIIYSGSAKQGTRTANNTSTDFAVWRADGTLDTRPFDPLNLDLDWANVTGIPVDIVYQSELADSTAAIRADFPTGGGGTGAWGDLTGIPAGFADGVDNVDDADASPTNELQDWNSLPSIPTDFADGVDNVDDADADAQNELQTLSYSNGVIGLTGQAGNITQSELNYWSSTVTELNSNAKSLVAVTNNDKLSFYENDVPQADAYFKLGNITGQTGKYIPTIFLKRNSTVSGFGATIISDALSNDGIPSLTISSRVNNSSSTNPILVLKNLSSNRFEVSSIGDIIYSGSAKQGTRTANNTSTDFAVWRADGTLDTRTFDPANINSYLDYDTNLDALYNNTGSKLGINTTTPAHAFHVANTQSSEYSVLFEKSSRKDFFIRNSSLYSSISNTTSSITGSRFAMADDYAQIGVGQGAYTYYNTRMVFPLASSDPSATAGTLWYNSTDAEFKYHNGTSVQSLGGGNATPVTPTLAQVAAAGNSANNKIQNLTVGTADTDAANVGQTYYNISTAEDVANYKYGGQTVYVKKLALTTVANGVTQNFPAISGFVKLIDMDVRFEYSGGIAKAGGSTHLLTNSGSINLVHAWEANGVVSVKNNGGTTINDVDIYVYYTK